MRIKSLDIYRGLTIISMVIVNSYGNEEHAYSFLKHAEWHGWKIADLIAPIFLFIMGISMSYSFKKRKNKNTLKKEQYKKIIRRSFTLFILGIITYNFPFYNLSSIRIMGVLQRVSIVYLMASIIVLNLTKKQVYILITVILLVVTRAGEEIGYGIFWIEFIVLFIFAIIERQLPVRRKRGAFLLMIPHLLIPFIPFFTLITLNDLFDFWHWPYFDQYLYLDPTSYDPNNMSYNEAYYTLKRSAPFYLLLIGFFTHVFFVYPFWVKPGWMNFIAKPKKS